MSQPTTNGTLISQRHNFNYIFKNHVLTIFRTAIKNWHTITNECEKGNPSYIANEDLK